MKTILLVVLFGLAACVTTPAQQAQRYSGTLYWSFETSAFRTDDGQGPYWLSSETVWPQVVAPLQQAGRGPYGRVHLVVEGDLSPPGRYGHLGAYSNELRVTRVIESTLIASDPQGS
jgi:hypothetical protein